MRCVIRRVIEVRRGGNAVRVAIHVVGAWRVSVAGVSCLTKIIRRGGTAGRWVVVVVGGSSANVRVGHVKFRRGGLAYLSTGMINGSVANVYKLLWASRRGGNAGAGVMLFI